ncbi:MAG: imidazoleglycerol-phosphate dehydratase, partial [Planctomycetes bacterium]|nr:imidazoleglycerol-phosphate dehydratase [Planctomycetota bacterium]
ATGVGFFDHMLDALARHGGLGIAIEASGDLHIDAHHLVEDVGIVLGRALRAALGSDPRIARFGHAYAPMDETLARVVVDLCGRGVARIRAPFSLDRIGEFDAQLVAEFISALAREARIVVHADLIAGGNAHHEVEAVFKALGLALRAALRPADGDVPSTKGTIST